MLLVTVSVADYVMTVPEPRQAPEGPYKGIADQNKNQQQEANLTNQQDEFDADEDGQRVSLWPCRGAPEQDEPQEYTRGEAIPIQWQSNNPHAGNMEVNFFMASGEQVVNAYSREAGEGYQRGGTQVTVPRTLEGCQQVGDCFVQFYFHSLEPRNYVTCSDFILTDGPNPVAPTTEADAAPVPAEEVAPSPAGSLSKRANRLPLKKRQVSGTAAMDETPMPARPCNDDVTYEEASTNYEPYCGQRGSTPYKSEAMWELTLPGERGKSRKGKRNAKKNRNLIEGMTQAVERAVKPARRADERALAATTDCNSFTNKKGKKTGTGAYRPGNFEVGGGDGCGMTMGRPTEPAPGASLSKREEGYNPMYLMSRPGQREYQTTYITFEPACMEALRTNVLSAIEDGDRKAKQRAAVDICREASGANSVDNDDD